MEIGAKHKLHKTALIALATVTAVLMRYSDIREAMYAADVGGLAIYRSMGGKYTNTSVPELVALGHLRGLSILTG